MNKILVTSALGVVSRGIINSIRFSDKFKNSYIIGTDIQKTNFGVNSIGFNRLVKSPMYSHKDYIPFMENLIANENPDAILITNELEITRLSNQSIKNALIPNIDFANIAISKKRLYEQLKDTEYVPKFSNYNRNELLNDKLTIKDFVWIRDFEDGTTGGKGAFVSNNRDNIYNWVKDNKDLKKIQISEFLPGRNLACTMIFKDGNLQTAVCGIRETYLLGNLVKSGVTGYTNKGKVFYDQQLIDLCIKALSKIKGFSRLNGVITIDLKEDKFNVPKITEINLRYIGFVFAYALSGYNVVENHLNIILGYTPKDFNTSLSYEFYRGIDAPLEVYKI